MTLSSDGTVQSETCGGPLRLAETPDDSEPVLGQCSGPGGGSRRARCYSGSVSRRPGPLLFSRL